MQLLIATANAGKVREFREMLDLPGLEVRDLSAEASAPTVEETGATFRDNACLKASAYASHFRTWALADDSGLEVDALSGRPGVTSSRWATLHGAGAGDADNNALLLKQLAGIPESARTARFVCVLALADPEGSVVLTARDSLEGRMLTAPRGTDGFGYDPLFYVDGLGCTTAELPPTRKHEISHRGRATRRMRALMSAAGVPR